MADLKVEVRSNVDTLSAERLHQALVDMVKGIVVDSTRFLRAEVPKDTGALEEHVGHSEIEDVVDLIEARIGVRSIGEAGANAALKLIPGAQDSSHYPIFVDRGTGIFGPTASPIFARVGHKMVFEGREGTVFAHSVKGQPGQHFMAATLAYANAVARTDKHIKLALEEMAARAAAELPAVLA